MSLAYIAACEADSPNSPDFERIHQRHRNQHLAAHLNALRRHTADALNTGHIDEEQFCDLMDLFNGIDPTR